MTTRPGRRTVLRVHCKRQRYAKPNPPVPQIVVQDVGVEPGLTIDGIAIGIGKHEDLIARSDPDRPVRIALAIVRASQTDQNVKTSVARYRKLQATSSIFACRDRATIGCLTRSIASRAG